MTTTSTGSKIALSTDCTVDLVRSEQQFRLHKAVQLDLNHISTWAEECRKCKVLWHKNEQVNYFMMDNGINVFLETTSEEKDLGIWEDDILKFLSHIGHIYSV